MKHSKRRLEKKCSVVPLSVNRYKTGTEKEQQTFCRCLYGNLILVERFRVHRDDALFCNLTQRGIELIVGTPKRCGGAGPEANTTKKKRASRFVCRRSRYEQRAVRFLAYSLIAVLHSNART